MYIIKKCMYMCMWSCFDKYIELQLGAPKQNFLAPPLCVGFWQWWVCDWCGHGSGGTMATEAAWVSGFDFGFWFWFWIWILIWILLWILDFDFGLILLSGGGWCDWEGRRWWWWWVVERVIEIEIRERSKKYFYIILMCSMVK